MSWKSILKSGNPIRIAEFCRNNPIDIAWACGFDLLTEELHGQWMRDMLLGMEDMTLQAHRGSYKTSCISIVIPIMIATNPNSNIIFIRKTDSDVTEIIEQAKRILSSPVMSGIADAIYGKPILLEKENATEIDTNLKTSSKGAVQLLGMGTKGSITGKHADIIITDDIVNLSDRASRAERERTKSIYQELQNIRNRGGRIINTGTPWHKDDAFTLMPNLKKYDCYATGLMTREQIEIVRQSMSPSLFACNYELNHIASEEALFNTPPKFESDATKIYNGMAHIDAAYGGGDGSAFTIIRKLGDTIYVLGKLRKKHIDNCLEEFLHVKDKFRGGSIDTEDNADKGYLAKEIRRRGGHANMPYHESMNKYIKISTYLKKYWRQLRFLEETDPEYIAEIMDYTENAEHDDAPDSLATLLRKIDKPSGMYPSDLQIYR